MDVRDENATNAQSILTVRAPERATCIPTSVAPHERKLCHQDTKIKIALWSVWILVSSSQGWRTFSENKPTIGRMIKIANS
jgi:hypothetical protein